MYEYCYYENESKLQDEPPKEKFSAWSGNKKVILSVPRTTISTHAKQQFTVKSNIQNMNECIFLF